MITQETIAIVTGATSLTNGSNLALTIPGQFVPCFQFDWPIPKGYIPSIGLKTVAQRAGLSLSPPPPPPPFLGIREPLPTVRGRVPQNIWRGNTKSYNVSDVLNEFKFGVGP